MTLAHRVPAAAESEFSVSWTRQEQGGSAGFGEAWFIHGMLEDERTWLRLESQVDAAVSLRPHFPWSSRNGQTWGREASGSEWIGRFVAAQPARPDIVVCHSYGCNAVLDHLVWHQDHQPDVLVLVAPFYAACRDEIRWSKLMDLADGLEQLIAESIKVQDPAGRYRGELLKDITAKIRDRLGVYGWFEFLSLYLASPDLPLERLRCPTLIVSGRDDRYSPSDACDRLAAALPHAEHVVLDANHFLQETHSSELAAAIRRFATTTERAIQS
jgi:pimeloyl-ACP methyl ester carboxylesterase